MRSIVFRLTVIVLCVILLSVAITATVAVVISGNAVGDQALLAVERGTKDEVSKIDSWLVARKAVVTTLANVLTGRTDFSDEAVRPVLQTVSAQNPAYSEVYIGFPNGWAVMSSGIDVAALQADGWFANERDWYTEAMTDIRNAHVTDPYVDTSTGELCITISQAIIQNGEVTGIAAIDIQMSELNNIVLGVTLDDTGYAMLIDHDASVLVHPGVYAPDMRSGNFVDFATVDGGVFSDLWSDINREDGAYVYEDAEGVEKYYTGFRIPSTGWFLMTIVPADNVSQLTTSLIMTILPVALVIIAVAAVIIIMSLRNVVAKPLTKLTESAEALAIGDIEITGLDEGTTPTNNEVIILERAFSRMVDSFKKQAFVLARIAEGDYTAKVDVRSEKDVINTAIELVLEGTLNALGQVASAGVQVADSSKQIAEDANALALGSSDQAATVEELSSSVSVIAQNTKENAAMAKRAAALANTIKGNAEKGSSQMNDMMEAVQQINQASQSIGKVIKVIDDIAFQTNILALNAAVEAARAGQHGKGFAVVAEEVRSLAAKSADAAKDTGGLISDSMEKAELGTRIASETAASLTEIVEGINESTKIVSDIAASSEEQTLSIDQINTGIEQVAQVVQKNSQTAEKSASAAQAMSGQSAILEDLIKQFQLRENMKRDKGLPPAK